MPARTGQCPRLNPLAALLLVLSIALVAPALAQPAKDEPAREEPAKGESDRSAGQRAAPVTTPSLSERTGVNDMLGRAPGAIDLILGIDQFNIFQTSVQETAGMRGDDALKAHAAAQARAAQARVKQVDAVVQAARLEIVFPGAPSPVRAGRVGGLSGATGPAYLAAYYTAQKAEHETAVSLLRRYLAEPDNEAVKAFAEKLLPEIEQGLKAVGTM